MSFMLLAVCAVVVQFTTDRLKVIVSEAYRSNLTPLIALGVGLLLAFGTQTGIFTAFEIVLYPAWLDYIITGIAYSGGAVVFNELVKLLRDMRG